MLESLAAAGAFDQLDGHAALSLDGHRSDAIDSGCSLDRLFDEMRRLMRCPVVFDGRNIYNPQRMLEAGFTYYSIGRPVVEGKS